MLLNTFRNFNRSLNKREMSPEETITTERNGRANATQHNVTDGLNSDVNSPPKQLGNNRVLCLKIT